MSISCLTNSYDDLSKVLYRMGNKNELNGIMEYLVSDDSSYATGQNFIIDGGYTSW